jgi:hypothetical protein
MGRVVTIHLARFLAARARKTREGRGWGRKRSIVAEPEKIRGGAVSSEKLN